MKRTIIFRLSAAVLASISAVFLLSQTSIAAGGYENMIKGEHEGGVLLVKFHPAVKDVVNLAEKKVNLPSVNYLNTKHRLSSIEPLFADNSSEQVYKLSFDPNTDLQAVLSDFESNVVVEYAEPNYLVHAQTFVPNDPNYNLQWNFDKINVPEAWSNDIISPNYGGDPSVVVAVLDTGVAYENRTPYVKASDLNNTNFVSGYDFCGDHNVDSLLEDPCEGTPDNYANDDNGHGTHVTGTIAQSTNNGVGVAGIAFNTSIMPVKVLNSEGDGTMGIIAQGVDFAVANGADIINLSLGGTSSSPTLEEAIQNAWSAGVIIVAATGNSGVSPILYPAKYDEVIAVGATGVNDEISSYSNYGTGIDLVAPGNLIYQQTCTIISEGLGDCSSMQYAYFNGTSMATPHVSAAAALLLAYGVDSGNIITVLRNNAVDYGSVGYDTTFGYGRLDIGAGFEVVSADINPPTNPEILAYDSSDKNVALNSGGRYEYLTPYFEWTEATDDVSGIAGYHVYFGTDKDADPELDGTLISNNFYMSDSLSGMDDVTYYLRLKTEDSQGNVSLTVTQFVYIIDVHSDYIVVGPNAGGGPQVRVFEQDGTLVSQFFAYAESFRGGVNVAVGDLDGDGVDEIVTGAGIGGGPQVRVFDYRGVPKLTNGFFAYAEHVRNGVFVAVGDLNGDGLGEIITGTGAGSGPHVRTFNRFGQAVFTPGFFAYAEHVRNGVYVATGDLDGNGRDEIITGTGQGSGPHVRTFNYIGSAIFTPGFFPYDPAFRGGVRVATGDLDGNGQDEILTVPGIGGGPQVRSFNRFGAPSITNGFFAFGNNFRGGSYIAGGDTDQNGSDEIIVSVGSMSAPLIRVFNKTGEVIEDQFFALPETFINGIIIASGAVK